MVIFFYLWCDEHLLAGLTWRSWFPPAAIFTLRRKKHSQLFSFSFFSQAWLSIILISKLLTFAPVSPLSPWNERIFHHCIQKNCFTNVRVGHNTFQRPFCHLLLSVLALPTGGKYLFNFYNKHQSNPVGIVQRRAVIVGSKSLSHLFLAGLSSRQCQVSPVEHMKQSNNNPCRYLLDGLSRWKSRRLVLITHLKTAIYHVGSSRTSPLEMKDGF